MCVKEMIMNKKSNLGQMLTFLWFLQILLILSSTVNAQAASEKIRLNKIDFQGLNQYGETKIIETSGLQIGQLVEVEDLKNAAQRLLNTGYFTKVGFNYRFVKGQMEVTFVVEESKKEVILLPCVFDNFVW